MIVLLEWCLPRLPLVVENNEEDKSTLYSDLIFLRKMCSFFVLSRDSLFSKISQILSLCIIKLEFLYSLWCKFRQPTSLFSTSSPTLAGCWLINDGHSDWGDWRMLCCKKKEGAPTLRDSMDVTGEHYAKWNKPGGEGQIPYDLTSLFSNYLQ